MLLILLNVLCGLLLLAAVSLALDLPFAAVMLAAAGVILLADAYVLYRWRGEGS